MNADDFSIKLDSINISHDTWIRGSENILAIETLDVSKNRTEISSINIINQSFIYYSLQRLSIGNYQAVIKLNESIQNITLNVTVEDNGKIMNELININLTNKSNSIMDDARNVAICLDSWIKENKLLFWLSVWVIFIGLIIISITLHYAKKYSRSESKFFHYVQ